MRQGKIFPERIKIMLPPSPNADQGKTEASSKAEDSAAEPTTYVNLSKTQRALEAQSLQKLLNAAPVFSSRTAEAKLLHEPLPKMNESVANTGPAVVNEPAVTLPLPQEENSPRGSEEPAEEPAPTEMQLPPVALAAPVEAVASIHTEPLELKMESAEPAALVETTRTTPAPGPEVSKAETNSETRQPQTVTEPDTQTTAPAAVSSPAEVPANSAAKTSPENSRASRQEDVEVDGDAPLPTPAATPALAPANEAASASPDLSQKTPPASEVLPQSFTPSQAHSARCIAVAGNPNCGKSTLFNALTGMRQKVGNYPGVTVEKKEGSFFGSHGEQMQLLDLPGCYSLQARSPDEAVSRDVLLGRQADTPRPDAVLAVLDATNLERNLYLLSQLLELGLPVFLGLNMLDLAEKRGIVIDHRLLSERLGVPVLPLVASQSVGLIALKQALSQDPLPLPKQRPPLPVALESEARDLAALLPKNGAEFAEAILLLGMPDSQLAQTSYLTPEQKTAIEGARQRLLVADIDPVSAVVDARYAWIGEIVAASVRHEGESGVNLSDKLDRILTHKIWGWLAFLGSMALVFFSIFTLAKIPADWISSGQALLGNWLQTVMPEGDFRSLVIDGVLAGVAGVLVFLPQILILTFFLGLLEDTGYMARAAFLMDRLMSRVGLHGKSFIPMLSSFACAIPGIMATRTIEQRKDRLVTILVSPLMSCSARLPVYTLLIMVLLPGVSVWKKAGIMLSMYVLGVVAAFLMAGIFKKTLLRSETPVLLMEMPPFRRPSLRGIFMRMLERAWIFLKRAGTVILALSVLLWALTTYPKPEDPEAKGSERIAHSVAGRLGRAIEPVIAPLGFDWKIGIGLIGSFAAREVFVSTMGIVYSVENNGEETPITTLSETMRNEKRPDGSDVYTPLTGTALMVFYVLAMQCLSTLAVVRRETNSWKWPAFQFCYMTLLAYAGALLVFQGGRLLGWH